MDTKIKSRFWTDPQVENLGSDSKLALLWLLTAHITDCGYVECSQRRFEFETGSPWQALLDSVQALGESVVTTAKGFWVRNYIREQIGQGERLAKNNMAKSIRRSLCEAPQEVQALVLDSYPELQALTKPYASPCASSGSTGEERRGEEVLDGDRARARVSSGVEVPDVEYPPDMPDTEDKAVAWVSGQATANPPPREFIVEVWLSMPGVGWRDGAGRVVTNWAMYVLGRWRRQQGTWKPGGSDPEKKEGGAVSPLSAKRNPLDREPSWDWMALLLEVCGIDAQAGCLSWRAVPGEVREQLLAEHEKRGGVAA